MGWPAFQRTRAVLGRLARRRHAVGTIVVPSDPELLDLLVAAFHAELRRLGGEQIGRTGSATVTERWRIGGVTLSLACDPGFGDRAQVSLSGRTRLVDRIGKAVLHGLNRNRC